ncbi:hypothetical protein [Olivibacter sitiensis]|uniref:hypothetical protein n=1 Tax=Olivibacter sitiensis TaxID=376470 RepID=UPI000411B7B5|nr:hypothetical protein [Olivibacter sitiensis]
MIEGREELIRLVQARYHTLKLSMEQAEKIFEHEKVKDIYSESKHFFSLWEEFDFNRHALKNILRKTQFEEFEKSAKATIAFNENLMRENDQSYLKDIAYQLDLIAFYKDHFVPGLFASGTFIQRAYHFYHLKNRVEYLKAEYKRFLDTKKLEIIINHFRFHRTFKPNFLKKNILEHHLLYIFPDHLYFKQEMDEDTRAIAEYIADHFAPYFDDEKEHIEDNVRKLAEFQKENARKHYPENDFRHIITKYDNINDIEPDELAKINASIWIKEASPSDSRDAVMNFILLDRHGYGAQVLDFY